MKKKLPLSELGSTLISLIKSHPELKMGDVGKYALGITYANFQKRLKTNNIKLDELEKLVNYLQLEIQVSIDDMDFSNTPTRPSDMEDELERRQKIMDLQEKVIQLQDKLQKYQTKEDKNE